VLAAVSLCSVLNVACCFSLYMKCVMGVTARVQLSTDRSVTQSGWSENILLLNEMSVNVTFLNFTSGFYILLGN
jgi:hypothetical protein